MLFHDRRRVSISRDKSSVAFLQVSCLIMLFVLNTFNIFFLVKFEIDTAGEILSIIINIFARLFCFVFHI